jgi:hypothetical protein
MMLLGLLLAVVSATPAPGLTPLKTIASVRSTPVCSALRERIAPAIDRVLDSDARIANGPPIFATMYSDDVVLRSDLRMSFDVLRMENLITPIAKNISAVKSQLKHLPQSPDLDAVRKRLESVIDAQNDALNVISGFVTTYQMGEMQQAGPASVLAATSRETTGSGNLYNAGLPPASGNPKPPSQQTRSVHLGYDPYAQFGDQLATIGETRDAAEQAASQAVFTAVSRCTAP